MKRTILYTISLAIAALMGFSAAAQQIMQGQAEVKNLSVTRDRDNAKVNVAMNVDISNLEVGADETLILTPVIAKGDKAVEMPSIEIMGRRAWMYWRRNGEQTVTANPIYAERA